MVTKSMSEGVGYLVFGATGAVGSACLSNLLSKDAKDVARVVTVGRRRMEEVDDPRLSQIIVQSLEGVDTDAEVGSALRGKVDVALCCLGTTRSDAGSAAAFRKVDVEYVGSCARLATAVGVGSFGLVSAQGANKNLWASDLKLFHGLLYAKSKGIAEELVVSANFPSTVILRPGLMRRGPAARFGEKLGAWILPAVDVEQVAKTMIDATTQGARSKGGAEEQTVRIMEMRDIMSHSV
jgi:oxidoreductase